MVKDKKFMSLAFAFGLVNGVFNVVGSILDDILDPYGFHTSDVSLFGTVLMIVGLAFAVICGLYIEKTQNYRNVFWFCGLIGLFTSIALPLALKLLPDANKYYWLYFFLIIMQGVLFIPIQPISIDYGIDAMFPVGEAQITGIMLSLGQIFGIVFVEVAQQIFDLGNP